jgi:predicted dehydrogenase
LKFLVLGTGSVGRRHIANLVALGHEVHACSQRAAAGASAPDLPQGARRVQGELARLCADVDAVVVANRNDEHMSVALEAARAGCGLFIEKPLSTSLRHCDELLYLERSAGIVVEAGFTLRAHPGLRWIGEAVADGRIGPLRYVRAAVGQWLPDWRPSTDHRAGYGALRRHGGGVIMDLIHEIDLVQWIGGPIVEVSAISAKVPDLEIETEAIAQIGMRLADGALAQVHLDYVRPAYGRQFEVVGRDAVLGCDVSTTRVTLESRASVAIPVFQSEGFERNAMFVNHMRHFERRLLGDDLPPMSSLADSVAALRAALAAHRACVTGGRERPAAIPIDYDPFTHMP